MALLPGTRLGPYEVTAPLGAGGMGEVYRARDTRLEREVAVKVIPESVAGDPERMRRFESEGRTAGALAHPNLLTVHDVGAHEGRPYIVSELLEGETLREALAGPGLPARKAMELAMQAAHGLAAAHEKGIVHRDVKPENLFLTRDGRIKILDFGLATTAPPSRPATESTTTIATSPGTVAGTVGYVSPEQVRGLPADARSDIFALGVVLYEMLSGRRAFARATYVETLHAILHEDPPPLTATVPPALQSVLRRCLEKRPTERFHSARDLAFALEAAAAEGSEAARPGARWLRSRWVAVGAVLATALAVGFLAGRLVSRGEPLAFRRLTARLGTVWSARFAPDGHTIVYSAAWQGRPVRLFTARSENREAIVPGFEGADVLSISSRGELALCLDPRRVLTYRQPGTLALSPLAGGQPRAVSSSVLDADWAPDGTSLAVARMELGTRSLLEFPLGRVLHRSASTIRRPRVSPRGDQVAFFEVSDSASVTVVDREGRSRTLSSGWLAPVSLAWSPGGDEVWFAAFRGDAQELRAVSLSGRERVLARFPGFVELHDVAPDGRVLLSQGLMRVGIRHAAAGDAQERDLSWQDRSFLQDLSPDGRKLLFTESAFGAGQPGSSYLRSVDDTVPTRLGEGFATALSPDAVWTALFAPGTGALRAVPTGAGEPRAVAPEDLAVRWATWFPEGRRMLLLAGPRNSSLRAYVHDPDAGAPRALADTVMRGRLDGGDALVSPDGRLVALVDEHARISIVPVSGGPPRALAPGDVDLLLAAWSQDGQALLAYRPGEWPAVVYRIDVGSGRVEPWKRIQPADDAGIWRIHPVRFSRDGGTYAYSYARTLTELWLVDGLR